MRHPYNCAHIHFVWATGDRQPLITPEVEARLYGEVRIKCEECGCRVVALGGTDNHLHLPVHFGATASFAGLMKSVKGATSHLINNDIMPGTNFKWQGAYGVFVVEPKRLPVVIDYINAQKQCHTTGKPWDTLEKVWEDE